MAEGFGSDAGTVEGDQEVVGESENSAEPPTAPPPTTQAQTPAATPPVTPQPAAAAVPPGSPTQATPEPQAPQVPPATPQPNYEEWRAQQVSALEKSYFVSPEAADKFLTEPEVALPKLAAQLHMGVMEQVMQAVQAAVPQWITAHQTMANQEKTSREQFYAVNQDLNNPAYERAILHMGTTFRQMNPTASADEAARVIGNMVRSALGLQAPPNAVVTPAAPAPAAAPQVFTPARGGGGLAAPVAPASTNPWASMAEEFLQEN